MTSIHEDSHPLDSCTGDQLLELVESNDALDKEEARILIEERKEEKARRVTNKPFRRLKRSPLEILNRSLFLVFLASFLFSFSSIYSENKWWFFLYLTSAFSCILYTPNRKALKELIDAWPNLEDLIKNRSLWRRK